MTAATTTELVIRALGRPARQGSKDFKGMRGGRPILVEADANLPDWRKAVIAAANNAMRAVGWLVLTDAVEVWIRVWVPRPKTVTREFPTGRHDGDLDKYERAIFDALTLAGVFADDSLVVDSHPSKRYADGPCRPGARIVVRPVREVIL